MLSAAVGGAVADVAPQDTDIVVVRPVMWMFIALLVTFLVTRGITRFIRARTARGGTAGGPVRDIVIGGVHIHHTVAGIFLMLAAGLGLLAATPVGVALDFVAVLFGIGVSLTFDEFALWLHLEDVYWQQEGRQSVDAMFCVLAATGALIGGADFVSGTVGSGTWWASIGWLAFGLVCSFVCLLKGKVFVGVFGIFLPPVAWAGAVRLAKPGSAWARRRYGVRPKRAARAHRRFGPSYSARWNRFKDIVAGAPNPVAAVQALAQPHALDVEVQVEDAPGSAPLEEAPHPVPAPVPAVESAPETTR